MAQADDPRRAALYMVLASLSFALMAVTVRYAADGGSLGATILARSVVIGLVATALVRARGVPIRWTDHRLLLLRDTTGIAAMLCYFWALSHAPLADAMTLQYTAPLFVAVLAPLALREPVSRWTGGWLAVGFAGVLLVVRPGASPSLGALAALGSAAFASVAYVAVRRLRQTEDPDLIVLHFAIAGSLFASPAAVGLLTDPPPAARALALLGVGVFASVGQVAMTRAFRFGEASAVSGLSYLTVAVGIGLGSLIYGEIPPWTSLAGAGLIAASGVALARPG